jgi:hypothetical protein
VPALLISYNTLYYDNYYNKTNEKLKKNRSRFDAGSDFLFLKSEPPEGLQPSEG